MATISGGVAALSIEAQMFIPFQHFVAKINHGKNMENLVSFTQVFPAHGFGNPQTYKIKNTGVDGPCPSYKIMSIAFEQKKTLGFWMFLGVFWTFRWPP